MKAVAVIALLATGFAVAVEPAGRYVSLQQEMRQAIVRGNAWLKSQQKDDGHWDDDGLPAFTALALTAAVQDLSTKDSSHVVKGYDWLMKQQKEDGGIYNRGLSTYNTATAITALVAAGRPEFEPAIVRARKHGT